MNLFIIALLCMLSVAGARGQNSTVNPPAAAASQAALTVPLGGYFVIYPQAPLITVHFDGASEDIAKAFSAPRVGANFNHDGAAFKGFVRSTSSESYNENVVDRAQGTLNVAQYKNNVKSGKWIGFANGNPTVAEALAQADRLRQILKSSFNRALSTRSGAT
jgi:hypothetical protein